jgi:serine/threonine protein kinase
MVTYKKKYNSKYKKKSGKKSSKKSSKKNLFKKGGDVLGKGSYGCVISPNLPCSNFNIVDNDKYISKLVRPNKYIKDDLDIINALNITNIRDYDRYLVIPIYKCNNNDIPYITQNSTTDIEDCINNKSIDRDYYINIIQNKGGITFRKYRKDNPNLLLKNLLPIYSAIFETIIFLSNNQIIHRDIKDDNILIEPNNDNKIKLIDFGFMAPTHYNLYSKYGNVGLPNEVYYIMNKKQIKDGFSMWSVELSAFRNWDIINKIYNLSPITNIEITNYYNNYQKYWLNHILIYNHKNNKYEYIDNIYYKLCNDNLKKINELITSINSETDIDTKISNIQIYSYAVNSQIDIFEFGIILLNDLQIIRKKDKQYIKLIDELIIYILENMLNLNSLERKQIDQAYEDFKNICKKYNITDSELISSNYVSNIPSTYTQPDISTLPLPPNYTKDYISTISIPTLPLPPINVIQDEPITNIGTTLKKTHTGFDLIKNKLKRTKTL